eukprot:1138995-Pelagomonas_calceolata.AAC.6
MAFAKEGTGIIFLESARCKGLACLYQPDGKLPVSSSAVKIASEQWKNCYLGDGKMGEYPGELVECKDSHQALPC